MVLNIRFEIVLLVVLRTADEFRIKSIALLRSKMFDKKIFWIVIVRFSILNFLRYKHIKVILQQCTICCYNTKILITSVSVYNNNNNIQ